MKRAEALANLLSFVLLLILHDRADGHYGEAKVMLRPAVPGTGVIAGGSVRIVLEMAGVENALGKQMGSDNALNNARATLVAVQKMRQFRDVARERGIPMEEAPGNEFLFLFHSFFYLLFDSATMLLLQSKNRMACLTIVKIFSSSDGRACLYECSETVTSYCFK